SIAFRCCDQACSYNNAFCAESQRCGQSPSIGNATSGHHQGWGNRVYHARDENHCANSARDMPTSLDSLGDEEIYTSTQCSLCRCYRTDLVTNFNADLVGFFDIGRGIPPEERDHRNALVDAGIDVRSFRDWHMRAFQKNVDAKWPRSQRAELSDSF